MPDHSNQCRLVRASRRKTIVTRGERIMLETETPNHPSKKTAFDRWKELITAPMRSQMPQNASRVDDNNTIHRLLICNNNTRERKKKWNRKENCSRYSFYPWTFWGRRVRKKNASTKPARPIPNTTDNTKGFAGSFSSIQRRLFSLYWIQSKCTDFGNFYREFSNSVPMNFVSESIVSIVT